MYLEGVISVLLTLACQVLMSATDDPYHSRMRRALLSERAEEKSAEFWSKTAQDILKHRLGVTQNTNVAKNIIFFLGDGMSIPTLAAARIYQGQLFHRSGEEDELSFEKFPYTGLSKTYCVNSQVADSACSATAYLGGVKANEGTIGVTAAVKRTDCQAMKNSTNHVASIALWAQNAGLWTGLVTTTRVTHASPAGLYAHSADRGWEDDAGVSSDGKDPAECADIAQQLIKNEPGRNFNVIMGGGRRYFYPDSSFDEVGAKGRRRDGQDLLQQWMADKEKRCGKSAYRYITTRQQLLELDNSPDYVLGLFSPSHLPYHLDGTNKDPSLEEMTTAAIKILSKSPNGFFLFVEGGRIDHGHHDNLAKKALDEVVELSKAVASAVNVTDEHNTLVVVTADHAHVLTFNGYAKRGSNIFGFAGMGSDGYPYTTLSYANGPGFFMNPGQVQGRSDLTKINLEDKTFRFPAAVPLGSESHGGDDVAVFARGPWSHLFTGSFEQNYIPHALAYAACLGKGLTACSSHPVVGEVNPVMVHPVNT